MKRSSLLLLTLFLCASVHAQSVLNTVNTLLLDAKYTETIDYINKTAGAQKDEKLIILLENKKAEAYVHSGKYAEAEQVLLGIEQKLKNLPKSEFYKAVTQTNESFLNLNQGRNDRALELLQKALAGFEQSQQENSLEAAQALTYLGITYINTGKYTQAEE